MTSYATHITPSAAPPRDRTGPVAALAGGSIAAVLALILLAGSGLSFWASHYKTDADGYHTSATHTYSTPTRALTTESINVGTGVPGWLDGHLGTVRIDPKGTGAFVGIARTHDVDAYLDQVAHDEITDLDYDPFSLDTDRRAGAGSPAMPAAQTFWAESSTDGRELEWKVREGEWTVVVMNKDASPGVRVEATTGAKVPLLGDLGWWLAIPGIAIGLASVALIVLGARGIARSREA
jgi:hypothetical protein